LLLKFLAKDGDVEEVLTIVTFCARELAKETYIIEALSSALSGILSQTKKTEDFWVPATHNRDFEQKQIDLVFALLAQLGKTPPKDEWAD
jgi:hypothetical protein